MSFALQCVASLFVLAAGLANAQQPNPNELLRQAINAQQGGDLDEAIRDYHQLLDLRPDSPEARVNLGAALVQLGQYDAGIEQYKKALPAISNKDQVRMNIAIAYYKKGDFQTAHDDFALLQKLQPANQQLLILLGDTDLRLNRPDDALGLLAPLEPAYRQNMDFEYVLGTAFLKTNHRMDGVQRLEQVGRSGSADAYMLAGAALLDTEDFDRARHDLDASLQLNPKLPGIYSLAGIARNKDGDMKAAEAAFRQALALDPRDFNANLYLGAILYKRRQLDESKTYLSRALELNPSSSMAIYEMAMWKSTSGQYDAAIEDLERLTAQDPKWLEPHVELASLYYKVHRPADGMKQRQIVQQLTAEQQANGPGV